MSVQHMMWVVNRADALQARARSQAEVVVRAAIRAFAQGQGLQVANDLTIAVPSFAPLRDSLFALPQGRDGGDLNTFRLVARSQVASRNAVAVRSAPERKRQSSTKLGSGLDA